MLSSEGVKSLAIVRVLRVAKLAKLARVMRLARIHARWERDLSVPFATLALGKFAVYVPSPSRQAGLRALTRPERFVADA